MLLDYVIVVPIQPDFLLESFVYFLLKDSRLSFSLGLSPFHKQAVMHHYTDVVANGCPKCTNYSDAQRPLYGISTHVGNYGH